MVNQFALEKRSEKRLEVRIVRRKKDEALIGKYASQEPRKTGEQCLPYLIGVLDRPYDPVPELGRRKRVPGCW